MTTTTAQRPKGLVARALRRLWRSPLWLAAACFLAFWVLPELSPVRSLLAWPLMMHDPHARGDAAYVMGGGNAIRERLDAAADLIHERRVPVIYLMANGTRSRYHFPSRRSRVASEWDLDYLHWLGVPREKVKLIQGTPGAMLDSLDEARQMSKALAEAPHIRKLIVVSSPAHMRRTMMAFGATLPEGVTAHPFAARRFIHSAEADRPLWREYVKLVVYGVAVLFE